MESALTSAFKERDHLNETLKTTIQEAEALKKLTHSLAKEKLSVILEKVCFTQKTANTNVTFK